MLAVLMPVLIIAGILLVITVLLSIADRLLVSYGECSIKVKNEEEEKEFSVHGGETLLSVLIDFSPFQLRRNPFIASGIGACM